MKILHVFDDDKFIDSAIKLIESVYSDSSTYYIIQPNKGSFKYVKSPKAKSVILNTVEDEMKFVNFIHSSNIQVVFFHALENRKQRLVNLLNNKIVKVWFIWGYDLYSSWPLFKRHIYEKETLLFLSKKKCFKKDSLKEALIFNNFTFLIFSKFKNKKRILPKKLNSMLENNFLTEFYKSAEKIDVVVPVVPKEYEIIKKLKINAVFAPFSYVCIEDILNNQIDNNTQCLGKNILIGNSADPSNNHVDVFKKIAKFNLKERKIIVPLGYGGSKDYKRFVIEKGNFYFGENFIPLISFMPLTEYNQIISSCGFVIFNHRRQQAVGNIITSGYLGAKLFLNKKSPVYKYYKSIGMNVYGTKDLKEINLVNHLTENQFNNNQRILIKNYARNAVKNKIKKLFYIVNKELSKK